MHGWRENRSGLTFWPKVHYAVRGILTKKYLVRRTVFVFLGGIPAFRGVRFEAPGWDLRERPAEDERGGSRPKLSHAA